MQQQSLVESPWLIWAEQLQRSLTAAQQIDPACQCHVLIDPSLSNAAEDEVFAEAMHATGVKPVPIEWQHAKLAPEHRPALVTVDTSVNLGSELLNLSMQMAAQDADASHLQQGRGQRIAGWLLSSATPRTLARHLGAMAVQALPDGLPPSAGRTRLLRFFDPLVLPVLWDVSDPEQRVAFMGPVQQWFLLDNGSELRALSQAAVTGGPPARAAWRAAQWRVLLCLDAFNPAAIGHGLSDELIALRPTVLATLGRMSELGIHEPRDLQSLASLALRHHPEFDRHPQVNQLLMKRTADQNAAMALATLTDDDWRYIADELNTRTAQR